ncbi:hypothetical protein [Butyrivibrio proteoclasticus]|uniref:hypothetical protein n=1 Tax=Butyrivibrio proteoclasticus TaxID=43305 RepID=UPI0004791A2D|nr:hypothetical protein [Butyrivibrio proteoclasticus]
MKNRVVGAILIGMLIMSACSFSNSKEAEQNSVAVSSEESSEALTTDDKNLIELDTSKIIEDQSFDIQLNEWGNVRFVSCRPDKDKCPNADASFYLMNHEQVIYKMPSVYENDIRDWGLFEDISFVAFKDINEDKKDEVIVGVQYITGAGAQGMIPRTEVRIFEDKGGSFEYSKDISEYITDLIPEDGTINDVYDKIKLYYSTFGKSTSLYDDSIDSQIQVIVKNRDVWKITYEDPSGPVTSPFSCYYITDYDHNGRLEITASECQGTGIYTSTSIYEVNSDFNGIELIDDNGDAPEVEYKKIKVFYNEANQTYMYIGTNHGKSGALWGGNIKCALCLENGVIHYDKIAAEEYQPKGEDSDELVFSYTDNTGATITKEQFETAEDELYKSYDQQEVSFGAIYNERDNVFQELSDDIMAQMLMKSYETFSGQISYDEFNEIEEKIRTS